MFFLFANVALKSMQV